MSTTRAANLRPDRAFIALVDLVDCKKLKVITFVAAVLIGKLDKDLANASDILAGTRARYLQ